MDELRADIRAAGREARRKMAEANRKVGDELIVKPARDKARGQPTATQKLGDGTVIRAASRARATVVVLGGQASAPWALGAEFGAIAYPQFLPWTGSGDDAGYVLWPTIRDQEEAIEELYLDTFVEAYSTAFPGAGGRGWVREF